MFSQRGWTNNDGTIFCDVGCSKKLTAKTVVDC